MANTYVLRKDVSSVLDLKDGDASLGPGVGNRYYVAKTTDTAVYNWLVANRQHTYSDGTRAVQSDIQVALNATVECRNDYVFVWPSDSDYDTTAVLTMSKKSVHLICPAGLGLDRGATNAARIHQNTAANAVIAISDASIEVAGFYLKNYLDYYTITVAATSYGLNIHNNMFPLLWSASPVEAILCAGDGGAWGLVSHRNQFISQAGDDLTCSSLITIPGPATGARVEYNDFFIGDGNIVTSCITNSATKGTANYNNFMTAAGDGTITCCITITANGVAIGNRATVGADALVTGGTDDISAVENYNALAGGTVADDLD